MRTVGAAAVLALSSCQFAVALPPGSSRVGVDDAADARVETTVALEALRGFRRVAVFGVRERLYIVCVTDASGAVYCARANVPRLERVSDLDGTNGLAISWDDVCAVSAVGGVSCASRYILGPASERASGAIALESGGGASCARLRDGALTCWGWSLVHDSDASPTARVLLRDVVDFGVGGQHAIARTRAGLLCVGQNYFGQCTDAPERDGHNVLALDPPTDLALGWDTSCALQEDGVWCWGYTGQRECRFECMSALQHEARPCRQPEPRMTFAMPRDDPYERIEGGRLLLCARTRGAELLCGPIPSGTLRHVASGVHDFAVVGASVCFIASDGTLHCEENGAPLRWDLARPAAPGAVVVPPDDSRVQTTSP